MDSGAFFRRYTWAACAIAWLAACSGCGSGTAVARPKNLVLISIDTLRADHLGCYGHARDTSPAIDALAARGTLFEDVTAASPWTLPSHASLLTGLYPSSHGVKDVTHRLASETLADVLARAGLRTLAVVGSHLVGDPRYGLLRGFDPAHTRYVAEQEALPGGGLRIAARGAEILEIAETWLVEPDDRPFFLFAHFYDVHTCYTPGAEYRARFVRPYSGALDGTTAQLVELRAAGTQLSPEDLRWLEEMYDAEIRQLDDRLAGFFAFLQERGLARETLIVLTSDHGEEFFEHGGLLHGRTQYQELLDIPLILAGPGVPIGIRVREPAHLVDVTPTVLGLLGIAPPLRFDGLDLTGWMRAPNAEREPRMLFAEADHNNVVDGREVSDIRSMVRWEQAKLCWDRAAGRTELYDLARDSGEQQDLGAEHPRTAEFLLERLKRFRERAGAGETIESPDAETLELLRALGYAGR